MNKLAIVSTVFLSCLPAANAQTQKASPHALLPSRLANLDAITVQVRTVRADILAYWLDPKSNPVPREFFYSAPAAPGFEALQGKPLVPGLEVAHAITPKNMLLLVGTPESVLKAMDIVTALDKPLKQVEVECQMVVMDNKKAEAFIKQWRAADAKALEPGQTLEVLQAPKNTQAFLAEEIKNGNLTIVTAPRVTAIDKLTAELKSDTNTPFQLDLKAVKYEGQAPFAYFTQSMGVRATPTLIDDNTISLRFLPLLTESLATIQPTTNPAPRSKELTQASLLLSSRYKESTLSMRDGETLVLVDTAPYKGTNGYAKSIQGKRIFWFVTSRVIRRFGDA